MDNNNNFLPLPKVEIRSNGGPTEVYIDGKRLTGVLEFKLEQDPMKDLNPIFTLKMRCCFFDVSTTAIPLLPAPWEWFYTLKEECKGFTDEETLEKLRAGKNAHNSAHI